MVERGSPGEGHEDQVGPACLLHLARGGHAQRVGVEDQPEQRPGVVGLLSGLVVVAPALEGLDADLRVDEVVDRVLEGSAGVSCSRRLALNIWS